MCGENLLLVDQVFLTIGSPPRVRGKQINEKTFKVTGRITPACAGKTMILCLYKDAARDHPRVCGENIKTGLRGLRPAGSPPRVRGKRVPHSVFYHYIRITPACAGKTCLHWFAMSRYWDHPRVCGENQTPSTFTPALIGSPPRVRGKLFRVAALLNSKGITPACAGKTRRKSGRRTARRDHPRVCGENVL